MMVLTLRVGEAVQIGEAAVVKVTEKSGQRVKLVIATALAPIRLIASGIIPQRFSTGVTGELRAHEQPERISA